MESEFLKIILDNEKSQHYNAYKLDRNYKIKREGGNGHGISKHEKRK